MTIDTRTFLPFILFLSFLFTSGCTKDAIVPDPEEPTAVINEYEIQNIQYFLADEDRIDTVNVKLGSTTFENHGDKNSKQQHSVNFDNLNKSSSFQLDTLGNHFPSDLDFSTFEVNVPERYYPNADFSYFPEQFFMSDTIQEKEYRYSVTSSLLDLTIPARTKITVTSAIDRHDMTCSFNAIILNRTTGVNFTVTGKWKGILRYFSESILVEEEALD